MRKVEYDFLTWTSFPSSLKLLNNESGNESWTHFDLPKISVVPGATLRCKVKAKQENVTYSVSHGGHGLPSMPSFFELPLGTFDWKEFAGEEFKVAPGTHEMTPYLDGGSGSKGLPGVTWFDDLRVYQDGVLIYSNDFSNWAPIIIPAEIITGAAMIKFIK